MKTPIILLALLITGFFCGCATPYRQPVFEASTGASVTFKGVVDQFQDERPLDVLFVHGMCTHDKKWARDAVSGLIGALGGDPSAVNLQFAAVPGTKIEIYQQTLPTKYGALRVNAIVWSPLTTPLKKQLCYDQTNRSNYCAIGDSQKPYPYERASLNRTLKDTILNDCLSDAMIYQGRSWSVISYQMQAAILQALATSGASRLGADPASMAEALAESDSRIPLVVITESLGSKVAFDAIYKMTTRTDDSDLQKASAQTFDRISQIFMEANQLPILALADQDVEGSLGISSNEEDFPEDPIGALLRLRALRSLTGIAPTPPSVVAFTDPNDLLSYALSPSEHRDRQGYPVVDVVTSNSTTYFGFFESPIVAHLGYRENDTVKQLVACGNPMSSLCPR